MMRLPPDRLYRQLLVVLPGRLREEAEPELVETFRQSHARVASRGALARAGFWCRMAADLVVASAAERWHVAAPPPRLSRGAKFMNWLRELKLAVRSLRRSPAFSATAVLTLALGIGATTAIFSVVNGVLLAPLPYRDPERLVLVWQELRARHVPEFPFPVGDIPDLKARGTLFDDIATVATQRQSLATEGSQPEQVRSAFVSANLFRLLGYHIELGRDFTDADATPPPPPPSVAGTPGSSAPTNGAAPPPAPAVAAPAPPVIFTVIISHEFWQRHFGGDASVLGRAIDLGGATAVVAGVVEPNAQLLFPPRTSVERAPDLWFASRADLANGSRTAGALRVIGRLKPGVTVAQAQTQMDGLASDLRNQFPVKKNAGVYIDVVSMQASLVSDVRGGILALMGAVVIVLLIACANVASLFLTQAARRERDLAVRTALGAGQGRLIGQLFAESVVLASIGAIAGVGLARLGIAVLQQIGPADLPRLASVGLDARVLAFAVGIAAAAATLFGLVPAWRASRPDVVAVLRKAGRTAGLGAGRLRGGLVIVEVALSFVLLVGSGLMLRSLIALEHVNPGYDPQGVLTFLVPSLRANTPEARAAMVSRLRDELLALPGVEGVGAATPLPLDGRVNNVPWGTEAAAADPTLFQQALVHIVQPGYFETMHAPLVEGRTFQPTDNVATATVVVIDNVLAAKAFPGQSAVGKKLLLRTTGNAPIPFEVIGVVTHERHASLAEEGREALFFTDGQRGFATANRWVVRTSRDPMSLGDGVKAAVARVDPTAAVADLQPMQAFVDRAQAPTRFALVLTSVFAGIAAVLAVVGLYGVLSTMVRQRTAEIGVRLAFGAERGSIFRLVVGRGLLMAAIGLAIGTAGALALTRGIASLLVGVRPTDPATFTAIAALFLLVAIAACGLPAYRASRLDPIAALRNE
jgi:putative ABC transport system permease protein